MKICVAGLGIIGGSLCAALKRAGYAVDGWNRSSLPLEYALNRGIIDAAADRFDTYDFVFVALPAEAALNFLETTRFKDGAAVSDICGVKKFLENAMFSKPRNFNYVGCHPMAGKEVSGIENAAAELFDGASMIITETDKTDKGALAAVKDLTAAMGFGRIVECSAEFHDRKIAYTSQLAHVVSNAYVKDDESCFCTGFTGGSYQDMTRIAGVDENVWASLYMKNSNNLSEKIENIIRSLSEIKKALDFGDEEKLKEVLKTGRVMYENGKNIIKNRNVLITKLR